MSMKKTSLFLVPANAHFGAKIQPLDDKMSRKIVPGWWEEACLKDHFSPAPIDVEWPWIQIGIEVDGRVLASERYAVVTGDGEIQGAMLISMEPVKSLLDDNAPALFLERLVTAPRNRKELRRDNAEYFRGVGSELLIFASELSRRYGYRGRISLDASPDSLGWYKRKYLKPNGSASMFFDGVQYTPMELTAASSEMLLDPPGPNQRKAQK